MGELHGIAKLSVTSSILPGILQVNFPYDTIEKATRWTVGPLLELALSANEKIQNATPRLWEIRS